MDININMNALFGFLLGLVFIFSIAIVFLSEKPWKNFWEKIIKILTRLTFLF